MSDDTLFGRPVVAILKPGDIVVLECAEPMRADAMNALRSMLNAWSEQAGVKYLLLTHPVKVARVVVDP